MCFFIIINSNVDLMSFSKTKATLVTSFNTDPARVVDKLNEVGKYFANVKNLSCYVSKMMSEAFSRKYIDSNNVTSELYRVCNNQKAAAQTAT
ncbi:hypothetical protein LOOC260_101310 [Paucilactobacillus hokkaidonensis JCM 18461]|uniref:Uncharacterized protein n=1 Tax=Paucilactobacillus hokkaidonensis JCM 18461 TaxID=1291742 RepID=A0A0A1GUL7_9LACO|nr:hypothetical protein LOOC260_101310 [Paucilactobacillus hokkaidonensis JCM 18461]